MEAEEVHTVCDIINCVSIFYEKGKSGGSFLRKERFRAEVPRNRKTLKEFCDIVRYVRVTQLSI